MMELAVKENEDNAALRELHTGSGKCQFIRTKIITVEWIWCRRATNAMHMWNLVPEKGHHACLHVVSL
jgi:hypothetical protein